MLSQTCLPALVDTHLMLLTLAIKCARISPQPRSHIHTFTLSPSWRQMNGIATNIHLRQAQSLSWAVLQADYRRETQRDQTGTRSAPGTQVYHPNTIPAQCCQASSIQQAHSWEQDCSLLRMSHSLLQRPSPLTDLPLSNHHVHLLFRRNINLFMSQNRLQVPHPVSNSIPSAKLLVLQPGLS